MNILQAMVLGVIQGLTEFLPVSSSGHLVIAQTLLGFKEPPILFDTLLHGGTLLAVIIFFWPQLITLTKNTIRNLMIATLPAVLAGVLLNDYIDAIFSSLFMVGVGLAITAFQLLTLRRYKTGNLQLDNLPIKSSLLIGIFQAIALIPGISRSGSTVAASLRSGLSYDAAFQFSFLLSIPAILGAIVLQLLTFHETVSIPPLMYGSGFFISLLTGLLSLRFLRYMIKEAKLSYFGYYCLTLSALLILSALV